MFVTFGKIWFGVQHLKLISETSWPLQSCLLSFHWELIHCAVHPSHLLPSCRWESKKAFSMLLAVEGMLVGKVYSVIFQELHWGFSSVQVEEQLMLMVTWVQANCCIERNIRANLYLCEILCSSHSKCPGIFFGCVNFLFCKQSQDRSQICHLMLCARQKLE